MKAQSVRIMIATSQSSEGWSEEGRPIESRTHALIHTFGEWIRRRESLFCLSTSFHTHHPDANRRRRWRRQDVCKQHLRQNKRWWPPLQTTLCRLVVSAISATADGELWWWEKKVFGRLFTILSSRGWRQTVSTLTADGKREHKDVSTGAWIWLSMLKVVMKDSFELRKHCMK